MGNSYCRKSCNECPPDYIMLNIHHNSIYHVWSLMSVSGDQYIRKTDQASGSNFLVDGNGKTTERQSIKIKFKDAPLTSPQEIQYLYMTFEVVENGINTVYTMSASEENVVAVKNSSGNNDNLTSWLPIDLTNPVQGYFVFQSNKVNHNNEKLYLSCDGNGQMRLKPSKNDPVRNVAVDVALLFRAVDPLED